MNKESTPRQFRNALFEHLVNHGVTEETAATISFPHPHILGLHYFAVLR